MAQNFIPNPSFEEIAGCPFDFTTLAQPIKTISWSSPTKGTPDLFATCATRVVSVPRNYVGTSKPRHGNNYMGMSLGDPGKPYSFEFREYLTVRLTEKLDSGKVYNLVLYTKPAYYSGYHINKITFALTNQKLRQESSRPLKDIPFRQIYLDTMQVENDWFKIDAQIWATGTEQYFTIGNFLHQDSAEYVHLKIHAKGRRTELVAYYLFDSFSLIDTLSVEETLFEVDKTFSMDNLYFEFDSHFLSAESIFELERLANFLVSSPDFTLTIYGNTDLVGSREYNYRLSERRAREVKRHLVRLGVKSNRIKPVGIGDRNQVSEIDALNRRTEFLLSSDESY